MGRRKGINSIYQYLDYRNFLTDWFKEKKKKNPRYSIRAFARSLKLNAGTVTRILQGKRNISKKVITRIIEHFKLRQKEAEYFELLVIFNQSKKAEEKRIYYERIMNFLKVNHKKIEAGQYEYFNQWYNIAVREILNFYPFDGDFSTLAKFLEPRIKPGQAKNAVKLLEKLRLIKKNKKGTYRLSDSFITTGEKWKGTAIHAFQMAMAELGKKSLDRFPKGERDISTLSLGLSPQGLARIREVLKETRKQIMAISKSEKKVNRAYQLNFHLFPLSKPYEKEKA
jgi:uncharacterized protein (TIGR02147 family)